MTYQLAKQLKDEGFPRLENPHCGGCECNPQNADITLSELIEACEDLVGDTQFLHLSNQPLINHKGKWIASSSYKIHPEHGGSLYEVADSPEEAVAKLWLALNK